ncbi:hypothetical protein MMC31_000216 [Peltigera leucophlebia]|nr:hypothetical protein [Peltigera leucophlebia]
MIFKPFTHLARQGISKTFTHGYAQSVVAASQSSYASSTTPFGPFGNHSNSRFGKTGTLPPHNAFHNASNSAGNAYKSGQNTHNVDFVDGSDAGLVAYYEAWQRQQQLGEGKEWKQFQFAKRIGWTSPASILDGKGKEKGDIAELGDAALISRKKDQAYSVAVADRNHDTDLAEIKTAAPSISDESLNEKNHDIRWSTALRQEGNARLNFDHQVEITEKPVLDFANLEPEPPISSAGTKIASSLSASSVQTTVPRDSAAVAPSENADSLALSDHISMLSDSRRFAEIPPAFASMLANGLVPSVKAYNALLAAAIHLPAAKHQIIPKALNVYSDMLKRNQIPDTTFYSAIIQLLSHRALDIFTMKTAMDQRRLRFGGLRESGEFLFPSNVAEYEILVEDDALTTAVKIFDTSITKQKTRMYSSETYQPLIIACAMYGRVQEMIQTYSHMEKHKVIPTAAIFPAMIAAFGKIGDISSAVECYNEYKRLAIADDAGELAVIDRKDNEVYAAVVAAYLANGNKDGGHKFFAKIVDSYITAPESQKQHLEAVRDSIVLDALTQAYLDAGDFAEAFRTAKEESLTPLIRSRAMIRICTAAADNNETDLAYKSYESIGPISTETSVATLAMLALHVRQGNVDLAREFWETLNSSPNLDALTVEPAIMYAIALIGSGNIDEGLMRSRQAFARIRAYAKSVNRDLEVADEIDEGIELVGAFLADRKLVPSPQACMSFLGAMIENGGLVSPVAEQLLSGISSENISNLSWQDLTLALQIEAEIVGQAKEVHDVVHLDRFASILKSVIGNGIAIDDPTVELIECALEKLPPQRSDLLNRWQDYRYAVVQPVNSPAIFPPMVSPGNTINSGDSDSFDPYSATTDYKGSALIAEELEIHRPRSDAGLNEALIRYRNMRRAGRHPRYTVYAKLISSAAKEGRGNLIFDILGMARQDIPLLPQYSVVRFGWSAILDSMVGACLTLGNRTFASQYHQELLDMGSAPTANTFGLYITTMKDSAKTFDEATEAVKIFHRAKSEGVEPSSFLYNALIGKLGKARRIDDCLYFFGEMRSLGIRPTSVTYGTIVNALCRVSDERFAEELFEEMETMSNYKPRPAPYNSLMQFYLTTKRDRGKVLSYYERMRSKNIRPTMHTYKLLIDTHATLDPINLAAAEGVLDTIRASGQTPEAIHYASLIHAKGCALHDMAGARQIFDKVLATKEIRPQACLYQALFESMVANHCVKETEEVLEDMSARRVEMTPYIANTLIHGWAMAKNIAKSKAVYESVCIDKREPSTYEAITRAFLTVEDRDSALGSVGEMLSRGYPSAVSGKILDLLGHGISRSSTVVPTAFSI